MKGHIGEECLYGIHGRVTKKDQRELFGRDGETLGTVVAVATNPDNRLGEATHESYPELGVPQDILDEFMAARENVDTDDPVKRHNTAVERVNLKERYKAYLDEDEEAQATMERLAERVASGEDITLLCVEERPMWCHRYTLRDRIETLAEEME